MDIQLLLYLIFGYNAIRTFFEMINTVPDKEYTMEFRLFIFLTQIVMISLYIALIMLFINGKIKVTY